MTALSIDYLADHPAMVSSLADAFRAESPAYFAGRSTTSIVETLVYHDEPLTILRRDLAARSDGSRPQLPLSQR